MKIFKRIMFVFVLVLVSATLMACGKKNDGPNDDGGSTVKYEVVSNDVNVYLNTDYDKPIAVVTIVVKNTDSKNLLVGFSEFKLSGGEEKVYDKINIPGMPQIVKPGENIYFYTEIMDGDFGPGFTIEIDQELEYTATLAPELSHTTKQLQELELENIDFWFNDGPSKNINLQGEIKNTTNQKVLASYFVVLYNDQEEIFGIFKDESMSLAQNASRNLDQGGKFGHYQVADVADYYALAYVYVDYD